jgi:hypothetical protein
MNLTNLKWTKNIRRADGDWAYSEFKPSHLFKLAWKDNEANANKPEKYDLILLRQQGYVTHLVRVLDYKAEREGKVITDYNIYRIVESLWTIDFGRLPLWAKADTMFGYSVTYQGGNVMELESLPTFKQRWDNDGGLFAFQKHIQQTLDKICM